MTIKQWLGDDKWLKIELILRKRFRIVTWHSLLQSPNKGEWLHFLENLWRDNNNERKTSFIQVAFNKFRILDRDIYIHANAFGDENTTNFLLSEVGK